MTGKFSNLSTGAHSARMHHSLAPNPQGGEHGTRRTFTSGASQALTEQLGPAAAAALMECSPPFGWHEIATKRDLAALEENLAHRFDAHLHAEMNRSIKWTVGAVFGGLVALGVAVGLVSTLVS